MTDVLGALKFLLLTSDRVTGEAIYCACPSQREEGSHDTACEQARAAVAWEEADRAWGHVEIVRPR